MADVLTKRELLERCRARLYGLMQADLSTELAALLADHAEQHLEMVEQSVEVVAWQDADNPLYTTGERRQMHGWATDGYPIVELCRISDARRAIAVLAAENARLRAELEQSDCALRESRANDTAAMGHLADMRQQRDKLAGLLLGLKVSVRDRAAGRAILADDVYELIDAALSELTP